MFPVSCATMCGLARVAYENSHVDFKIVVSEIPSGLPAPDGAQQIRNAAKTYRSALDAYETALRELDGL